MYPLLDKLCITHPKKVCEMILEVYKKQGSGIINYVYFAGISSKKLLSVIVKKEDMSIYKNNLLGDWKKKSQECISSLYAQSLQNSDFLLLDGIALQLYYWIVYGRKKRPNNLNGTDFLPYFLEWLSVNYERKNIEIVLYGTHPRLLEKAKKHLEHQSYTVVYSQDGYSVFDWTQCEQCLTKKPEHIRILLLGMTTPAYPVQELWAEANREEIQKNGLLCFGQGGTFDFWAGEQKRAPKIVRKIKLEWAWRVITNPKRNVKKVIDSFKLLSYIFSYLLLKK